ncbi:MAG TPA: ABC transporter permease [Nocardioidaceae bacterium]|nr:ABC transporter permease [Nocardioidaceae bacterium]
MWGRADRSAPVDRDPLRHRAFWAGLSAPGIAWLAVFVLVPFYAVLAVAGGQINEVLGTPVPAWNPLSWGGAAYQGVFGDIVGAGAFLGPVIVRTLVYVAVASTLALLIGYPVAYYVSRFAGKRRGLLLALLLAPFWVSYMMRMLAWIDLLQSDGYVNRVLQGLHIIGSPVNWLGGESATVVLGLVYGYLPYLILVLFAGLDRIDPSLIEAGRDLGLNRARTFVRITLPLSRQSIVTGLLITVLPMIGDYYTNTMLSGTSGTSMIGNVIDGQLQASSLQTQGAVLSLLLLGVLLLPMLYYVIVTNRASVVAS